MSRRWILILALMSALSPVARPLWAETRYVADVIVINLRDAPRQGAETVAHLRTGDAMEVLGAEGSYFQVKTAQGEVGWVLQQYTDRKLPKAQIIANLKADLSRHKERAAQAEQGCSDLGQRLEQQEQQTSTQLGELQQTVASARGEAAACAREQEQVRRRYQDLLKKSEGVLEIAAQRDQLQAQLQQVTARHDQLREEVGSLTRSTAVRWFLAGGGVFFLGWVVGSTSRKKRGKYSVG